MPAEKRVSIVVLASGFSRRLGRNKLVEQIGRKTLLEHVIGNAMESDHYEVIVVVEPGNTEISKNMPSGIRIVENHGRNRGLSSAVMEGVSAIDPASDAALFMVGDQPFVKSDVVNRLICKFREEGCEIVACSHSGVLKNPMLFSSIYFDELEKVEGDVGARQVADKHSESVCRVEITEPYLLLDVDTEDDLENARKIMEN